MQCFCCVCRLSLAYAGVGNLRRIVNRGVQALAKGDVAAAVSCVEKLNVRACLVAKRAPSCCLRALQGRPALLAEVRTCSFGSCKASG